jgi:hypothetical protein
VRRRTSEWDTRTLGIEGIDHRNQKWLACWNIKAPLDRATRKGRPPAMKYTGPCALLSGSQSCWRARLITLIGACLPARAAPLALRGRLARQLFRRLGRLALVEHPILGPSGVRPAEIVGHHAHPCGP